MVLNTSHERASSMALLRTDPSSKGGHDPLEWSPSQKTMLVIWYIVIKLDDQRSCGSSTLFQWNSRLLNLPFILDNKP